MSTWRKSTAHSHDYARRWQTMIDRGHDIDGEARLIDALVPRRSRILDAGCGQGRVGGYLAQRGHDVVGVDIDPVLIDHAAAGYPEANFHVGDLCTDPLPQDFDVVVSAGNVMCFLDPHGRQDALRNIAQALATEGRFVAGFGAGRGWAFDDFLADASEAGLEPQNLFESWDLQPLTPESGFLVAILTRRGQPGRRTPARTRTP